MAKINLVGDAVVIKSEVTLEELKKVQKYAPKAMVLVDEESKTPEFMAGIAKCGSAGGVNSTAILFAPETNAEDGEAIVTLVDPGVTVESATEKYGVALMKLNRLEGQIAEAYDKIAADFEVVADSIEVVG